ncbi:hypothetical protein PHMEG_00031332 [Phytophthora megakarya]|uniref:Uncharacterized protein n=1 Tax=Phytophthora megakarya TaxID=4795 RepID=A0A225UYH5_9STRA|nr:hypothetical protein PHMEG_00031332 [Phytophthora megakarya]
MEDAANSEHRLIVWKLTFAEAKTIAQTNRFAKSTEINISMHETSANVSKPQRTLRVKTQVGSPYAR